MLLDELVVTSNRVAATPALYVRWSGGPEADGSSTSVDELSGKRLPGLSVNGLSPEPWWGDGSLATWVARRLYDYRHVPSRRRTGARASAGG